MQQSCLLVDKQRVSGERVASWNEMPRADLVEECFMKVGPIVVRVAGEFVAAFEV